MSGLVQELVAFAAAQARRQLAESEVGGEARNPRTIEAGAVRYIQAEDWTSGFRPGGLWLLLELTGDESWRGPARRHCAAIESARRLTRHHDVGFMIGCSFGNGLRSGEAGYGEVIVEAAHSLGTRWRPSAGVIQSWDTDREWMASRGWECPVIIDSMMNLELLMSASSVSGDPSFGRMGTRHADRILGSHYRPDGSCWHVVDFSLADGTVRSRETAQGFSDSSAWARGQAWGIYGFAAMHRWTGETRYLERSLASLEFIARHPRYPADGVPHWDFDAPGIPEEPRDASAAAILASALYEISAWRGARYRDWADRILESLGSSAYRAKPGADGNFLLLHSVGSLPHGSEIDVPLNYADYYFLEALLRRKRIEEGRAPVGPAAGLEPVE